MEFNGPSLGAIGGHNEGAAFEKALPKLLLLHTRSKTRFDPSIVCDGCGDSLRRTVEVRCGTRGEEWSDIDQFPSSQTSPINEASYQANIAKDVQAFVKRLRCSDASMTEKWFVSTDNYIKCSFLSFLLFIYNGLFLTPLNVSN